jgi:hypothetical protein
VPDLPFPPIEDLPVSWDDMTRIEKAFFVYRWRVRFGWLPETDDPLQAFRDAGFIVEKFDA